MKRFYLSPDQLRLIDAQRQQLATEQQRSSFEIALAGKISLHSRPAYGRTITTALLRTLISAAADEAA